MKIAIIKERKNPPDRRVVLTPKACAQLKKTYPDLKIEVESSDIRTFSDEEYMAEGIPVVSSVESADVLLGVKEVPIDALIPNKKYFFFSHTIKKQPYNKKLLQSILEKNIELYDHEVITDENEIRLVAFGRYAGIVGAYNGLRTYGLKSGAYQLPKAETLTDQQALIAELSKIDIPPIKIVLTGKGRVGNGAKEMLDGMGLKELNSEEFLNKEFNEATYAQIDVLDYNKRVDGQSLPMPDFFENAAAYKSDFFKYAQVSDLYIAGHFYAAPAPYLFTREDARHPDFKIKVVADISCDIDGPVASTLRASTIAEPNYGYEPLSESEVAFDKDGAIAVMAVDNLPNELPRDASEGFSNGFVAHVIPAFFDKDQRGILHRARMTENGKLTKRFGYLEDYVSLK